jgi:hypothetical protein
VARSGFVCMPIGQASGHVEWKQIVRIGSPGNKRSKAFLKWLAATAFVKCSWANGKQGIVQVEHSRMPHVAGIQDAYEDGGINRHEPRTGLRNRAGHRRWLRVAPAPGRASPEAADVSESLASGRLVALFQAPGGESGVPVSSGRSTGSSNWSAPS